MNENISEISSVSENLINSQQRILKMSSPGNKGARYEDTNRVQEDFTPAGNSNADKSPHHPNRAVKQTTVTISRAELEPAIQSQARQNLESSWHRRGK